VYDQAKKDVFDKTKDEVTLLICFLVDDLVEDIDGLNWIEEYYGVYMESKD
jgi:hypothetical protein